MMCVWFLRTDFGQRKSTPKSCPLIATHILWRACAQTHTFSKQMLNKRSSRKWFIFWTNHNLLITTTIYWEPTMCQTLLRDKTVKDKYGKDSRLITTAVILNESIQGRQIYWKACPKRLNWGLQEWSVVGPSQERRNSTVSCRCIGSDVRTAEIVMYWCQTSFACFRMLFSFVKIKPNL